MSGQNFMDEIDCGSFFDHIDDLIEFPPVGDTSLNSVDCNDFTDMWTNNSDELQVSDPIFCGSNNDSASALSAELAVPYEDIAQLEWLSNFVEDSFSGGGMTINKEKVPVQQVAHHHFQTSSPVSVLESSSSSSSSCSGGSSVMVPLSPIQRGPQRARSKRPRPATFNPRSMIELLSPLVLMPVSVSSDSEKNFGVKSVGYEPEQKKKKKVNKPKIQEENKNQNQNEGGVRKCMHCEITKTPQWRAGPMGPKTLCNACGVRYKSGRLFPEYRPAASPTFVPSVHSNSHKKVVEMRSKGMMKNGVWEAEAEAEAEAELIPNINPGSGADYI